MSATKKPVETMADFKARIAAIHGLGAETP